MISDQEPHIFGCYISKIMNHIEFQDHGFIIPYHLHSPIINLMAQFKTMRHSMICNTTMLTITESYNQWHQHSMLFNVYYVKITCTSNDMSKIHVSSVFYLSRNMTFSMQNLIHLLSSSSLKVWLVWSSWASGDSVFSLTTLILISHSSWYSLKFAILPNSSTSSITSSSLSAISTNNEVNAANGSASENSRLVIAMLLSVRWRLFLFESLERSTCLLLRHASKSKVSVLGTVAGLEQRKRGGWDLMAMSSSCKAPWSSSAIWGEQWQCFLMESASSVSTFATSSATCWHGCLKRALTDRGVYQNNSKYSK